MSKRLLAYDEVTLPSGLDIRGVRPTAQELIRRGLWPANLRLRAILAGSSPSEDSSPEDQALFVESQHISVAAYIRQERDPETGAWEPVHYSPAEVHDFPPEDLDALEDIVLRHRTPAEVTATSRAAREEITDGEAADVAEQEAAATVDGWEEFRGDAGSAPAGEDREDVELAPVGAAPDHGQRRRPRGRRGAGDPIGEG